MVHEETPIQPGSPLPGTKISNWPRAAWYDGPPTPLILTGEAPIYASYTQTIGKGPSGITVRDSIGYGSTAAGSAVRAFLQGSLKFWVFSEATMTEDGTIHYRQGDRHHAIMLTPHRESGLMIVAPEKDIVSDAYCITGHDRVPQVWSRAAVQEAVKECSSPGPIDWPHGWALLMPDETVKFAPRGTPWSSVTEYVGTPVPPLDSWGLPCSKCSYYEGEHDPNRAWGSRCWHYEATVTEAIAADLEAKQAFRDMWRYGYPRCPLTKYAYAAGRVADALGS